MQSFIIGLFCLLYNPFKAYISTYFISIVVKQKHCNKPCHSSIAVKKRMDTEEVKDIKGDENNGVNVAFF